MIKRSESESPSKSRRKRTKSVKRRRLAMEGLEDRRLLAVAGGAPVPTDIVVPSFGGPRNLGTVTAVSIIEDEAPDVAGENDTIRNAQFVNLGNLPGQDNTIDLTGSMPFIAVGTGSVTQPPQFITDLDTFAFDLKAGDILDFATVGTAGSVTLLYENGSVWFGVDDNQTAGLNPVDSPLQTFGITAFAQVIPEDGRYYMTLAPVDTGANYTLGLRTYRPTVESLPIGTQQILFVDFDGAIYPRNVFSDGSGVPQPGVIRFPTLRDSLPLLGIQQIDDASYNRLIDLTMAEVEAQFQTIVTNGTNGDFDASGIPGEFAITVLNSRDDLDPGLGGITSRVLIGGTQADAEQQTIGLAENIDVGNFSMDDIAIGLLDSIVQGVTSVPIAVTSSILEATADFLALLITHEAGHFLGLRHTLNTNEIANIIDSGGRFDQAIGVGPDGIYGTVDDVQVEFSERDLFAPEGILGTERTADSLAHSIVSGKGAGILTGRAFNDFNRNGVDTNEPGVAGASIFADLDGDGIQDPTEPVAVTGADGVYTLNVPPGTFNLIATAPPQFAPTTPLVASATVSLGATSTGNNFGFIQVISDITGTKFSDNNGNGLRDSGEPGIPGVFIYLDLDGDDRPDIGEPSATTGADGSYSINFPGPGEYTIREVVEPGFIQTFPANGEHVVTFNGIALGNNFDFGNLPSRDFGDAPDTYRTTIAAGGPSHGITAGLTIGAVVDRELNGQPTGNATGDDVNGRVNFDGTTEDDEDGVRLLSPLGPGDSATVELTLNNTTGSPAFVQAWMDFNIDGDFDDPGEQLATDLVLGTGRHTLPVFVPATATIGTTYARVRYSQTAGLGPGGDADTGEVEDYSFPILDAALVANNDSFSVSRNTTANQLDVLRNDFETVDNQLTIIGRSIGGTQGQVVIANDGRSIFYSPPNGFIGRDTFGYTVRDEFGTESSATVVVNVTFQSAVPIALDDSFNVPQGSVNRALNVLDNDVPSIAGGISITSVTAGNQGGNIQIVGGGQSIRYTPLPGFNGTEQFTYSIQDAVGAVSSAQVTVNLQPGSQADDVVEYTVKFFDVLNNNEITNVRVGDVFNVRVFVDQVNEVQFGDPEGVVSGFLDLLYTDELVATRNTTAGNPNFPFDISFGPLFTGGGIFQTGDSQIPGLFNEIGGVQPILNQQEHTGAVELLTLTMQAVSPGVAVFAADPADNLVSETIVIREDRALEVNEIRLGRSELTISAATADFSSAIDDSFPAGLDSNGDIIVGNASTPARLNVLANDNLGPTGTVTEFGLVRAASRGDATVNDNGTPGNLNDDYIQYIGDLNANGFDSFTYVIVTADGIRSTATVNLTVGNAGDDDLVAINFGLVNASGTPISSANVGDRIGITVSLEDIRQPIDRTFAFAGFVDVLYDSGILSPADTITGDDFNFDVVFDSDFIADAGVGTAVRPGIIDEFGTLMVQSIAEAGGIANPNLMATIFFNVTAAGTTTVTGGPADFLPFQDTLLFNRDEPVPVEQIRYDTLTINVPGAEPEARQNTAMPQDVNADGDVSPIDALLIINRIGQINPAEAEGALSSQVYTDVNGDGQQTAGDALRVINYLATQRNKLEGESVVANIAAPANDDDSSSGPADSAQTLNDSQLIGDSAAVPSNVVAGAVEVIDLGSSDDDDEDDVLNLLADDVANQWS